VGLSLALLANGAPPRKSSAPSPLDQAVNDNARQMIEEGRRIFRYDTFGDEQFWTDALHLNRAIAGSRFGGVGGGVSPKTALAVGLKVDVDAVPSDVAAALRAGKVNLDDPASTMVLLKANAVVGVTGHIDGAGNLTGLGVQCAFCHSTVDDSFAPGIGHRRDGFANRDLNVGAIVNLSPDLSSVATLLGVPESAVRTVLQSWGPGKFDAELFLDRKTANPATGQSSATLIPAAYGLAGVNLHTYTGKCAVCHVPPTFTEPGWNMHSANELKIDSFQSDRAPDKKYRTTPLRGLWAHAKGGFYHDGRFATLADVVEHYDSGMTLGLTPA